MRDNKKTLSKQEEQVGMQSFLSLILRKGEWSDLLLN